MDIGLLHGPVAEEQASVFRPDFKPRGQPGEAFISMRALHEPAHLATRIEIELGLHQIEVDSKLAVDLGSEPMLHDFVDAKGERRENEHGGGRIPQGKAQLQGTSQPPSAHGEFSSRKTKPTPRTVWMSFT